jgi:hypothetical protein
MNDNPSESPIAIFDSRAGGEKRPYFAIALAVDEAGGPWVNLVNFAIRDGFGQAYEAMQGFRKPVRRGAVLLARGIMRLDLGSGMPASMEFSPRHPHAIVAFDQDNRLVEFDLVDAGNETKDRVDGLAGRVRGTGRGRFIFVSEVILTLSFDGTDGPAGPASNCAAVTIAPDGRQRIFDYRGPRARQSAIERAKQMVLEDGEVALVCESVWQATLPLDEEDFEIALTDESGSWVAMYSLTPGNNSGAWCFRGENACEEAKRKVRELMMDRVGGCVSLRRVIDG